MAKWFYVEGKNWETWALIHFNYIGAAAKAKAVAAAAKWWWWWSGGSGGSGGGGGSGRSSTSNLLFNVIVGQGKIINRLKKYWNE